MEYIGEIIDEKDIASWIGRTEGRVLQNIDSQSDWEWKILFC